MKCSFLLVLAASLSTPLAHVIGTDGGDSLDLAARFEARAEDRAARRAEESGVVAGFSRLFKRKGGGGRSGGGSSSSGSRGGSSSSGSSSGSSSSRSGSSGSSSSGSRSSTGKGSTTSNSGGRTTTGSGTPATYGGGTYYGGGASVPYKSGQKSPSGISPLLIGAGVGLAFWPGLWFHPIYYYPYSHPHSYYNQSSKQNETTPVACACDETVVCGCDENTNSTYFNDIIGNGSYSALNTSVVNVAEVNGTKTILINGTLANGTTAAGGTEDPNAASSRRLLLEQLGWWPVAATVLVMVYAV